MKKFSNKEKLKGLLWIKCFVTVKIILNIKSIDTIIIIKKKNYINFGV